MSEEEFSADDLRIELADSGQVRLVWGRDNAEHRVVVLDSARLPVVAREFLKQIADASTISMGAAGLLSETGALVAGLGFSPEPDHFRLTVYVEAPEQAQGFEISLRFSKPDLIECASAMADWLERA